MLESLDIVQEVFKRASVREWFQDSLSTGFSWKVPSFANLMFANDGSVVLDSNSSSPYHAILNKPIAECDIQKVADKAINQTGSHDIAG